MGVSYVTEDVWESLIYTCSEMVREGLEVKVSYGGMEAGISFDETAMKKLAELFESGVPLETAIGIDLPRMLSSIKGEVLEINIKTRDSEINFTLKGESLERFRDAMQMNPVDGEVVSMISSYLKILVD